MNDIDKACRAVAPIRRFGVGAGVLGAALIPVGTLTDVPLGNAMAGSGSVALGIACAFLLTTSRPHLIWLLRVASTRRPTMARRRGLQPIRCACPEGEGTPTPTELTMARATGLDVSYVHAMMDVWEGHATATIDARDGRDD